jgi:hypothetical protein
MTVPQRPPLTDEHPVWVHLITLAIVACLGLVTAVLLDLADIPWPETVAMCVWFACLCLLTAVALTNRLRPPV